MSIKKYIKMIVDNGNQEQMEELSDMLDEVIVKLKNYDSECYHKYKNKLMGMAYNYHFTPEFAKEIVSNMKPLGEYWNMDTTTMVKNQHGINATNEDFYIVMNSMANDYGDVIDKEQVETYIKLANAFINDKDSVNDKIWIYYTKIPKED